MEVLNVTTYWYQAGRYTNAYVEITQWINKETQERKETKRMAECSYKDTSGLPEWAKLPMQHNPKLDYHNL